MFLLSKYAASHQKNGCSEGEGCNCENYPFQPSSGKYKVLHFDVLV